MPRKGPTRSPNTETIAALYPGKRGIAIRALNDRLETRRKILHASLNQVTSDSGLGKDRPSEVVDAADQSESDEMHLRLKGLEADNLQQIEEALARMRNGDYGVCEACRSLINITRLQALPFVTFCKNCQEMKERGEFNVE